MVALAAGPLQSVTHAQEGVRAPQHSAAEEADSARLAGSRNRESMRDGESDVLVPRGTSQGDNDFRAMTPALRNSAGEVAMVDIGELRARALAMYEEGATFDSPPRTRSIRTPALNSNYAKPVQPSAGLVLGGDLLAVMDDTGWGWITPLLCFCLLVLFLLRYAAGFRLDERARSRLEARGTEGRARRRIWRP